MNKRTIITLQIGLISFFMFADQNLMGPNLTSIAEDFGLSDIKDKYLGGIMPLFLVIRWNSNFICWLFYRFTISQESVCSNCIYW